MKRFFVFAGIDYEALGGWRDFVEDLSSLEEAKRCGERLFDAGEERECGSYICPTHGKTKRSIRPNNYRADWAHVVDTENGDVLALFAPEPWCSVCEVKPEWPVWQQMADESNAAISELTQ